MGLECAMMARKREVNILQDFNIRYTALHIYYVLQKNKIQFQVHSLKGSSK